MPHFSGPRFAILGVALAVAACATDDPEPLPAPALSITDNVPVTEQCPVGGTRVRSGHDEDRSGTLEPGEIETSTVTCIEPVTLHGDIVVTDDSDPALLTGVTYIDGSLSVTTSRGIDLSQLVHIRGDLRVRALGGVIDLGALVALGGGIEVHGRMTFQAPQLTRIAFLQGFGSIEEPGVESSVVMTTLTTVDNSIAFFRGLRGLGLPALRTVGSLNFSSNSICTSVLQELAQRTGASARISNNGSC